MGQQHFMGQYAWVPTMRNESYRNFLEKINKICLAVTGTYLKNRKPQIAKTAPFEGMDME